ncbi:MAG: D-alanine--D-alanine ligase [Lactobacillales bacterium]|jgi:D-alanine-D-alanine ligase|nr:D-alanine--D-alanine ligase [Lactobacillales bacterium]
MKKRIVILYGGRSAEREISILSALSVIKAFDYRYYEIQTISISLEGTWLKGPFLTEKPTSENILEKTTELISPCFIKNLGDVVFPVLHGPMGEDGTIQGFLETINMPYVGTGVLASAVAMDKITTKYLLQTKGILQLPFVPVLNNDWSKQTSSVFEKIEGHLVYPVFVKPANTGSSIGISRAENRIELQTSLELAFQYDSRALVEQGIKAREIEIGVIGNDDVQTTNAGEIIKNVDFYDYHAKYIDNQISMDIPANIPEEINQQAREYAKKIYITLAGSGLARCDFFLTKENKLFFNELNTMPGFTEFSMYPLLWENMGLNYSNLIEELIHLAEKRFAEKQHYFAVKTFENCESSLGSQ